MKTPKEILLEAHQAMEPRLAKLREEVLATELNRVVVVKKRQNIVAVIPVKIWNELIWPSRRAWAGLAAVWVALAVVHFAQVEKGPAAKPGSDAQLMAEWDEQQKILEQYLNRRTQLAVKVPSVVLPATPDKSVKFFSDKSKAIV